MPWDAMRMNSFLRKALGFAFLATCAAVAIPVGQATRQAMDDAADATFVPAAGYAAAQGFTPATPSACQAAKLAATREALGASDAGVWYWASDLDTKSNAWGLAFYWDATIVLDTSVPCDHLASVVTHEYVHLMTPEADLGGHAQEELSADCVVARLLPSLMPSDAVYAPYLDRSEVGCAPVNSDAALAFLASHDLAVGGSE